MTAQVSFVVSTVGLTIPFAITEGVDVNGIPMPISNALNATVTWISQDGRQRPLTLLTPVSAVFVYEMSAQDWRSPHYEQGQLRVSIGTAVFWTSSFTVQISPHI